MKYQIKLEVFEGPFDLLLHLIQKNEIDIYDIPIAEITNQYLAYIKNMQKLDLDLASEFLVMAATLLAIKAKMLLPKPSKAQVEDEEEYDIDPRDELVEKLLEYKKYKLVANFLQGKEEKQRILYSRPNEEEMYLGMFADENPLEGLSLQDLLNALRQVVSHTPKKEMIKEIPREGVTVKGKMEEVRRQITARPNGVNFKELFNKQADKFEIIMVFLALLELIRLQAVVVKQVTNFESIIIYSKDQETSES